MAAENFLESPTTSFERPEYIEDAKDVKRFDELREMIAACDSRLMTSLDADQLARYVLSEHAYIDYTRKLKKALRANDIDLCGKLQRQQDAAFKQVQACASALGMNISSRLKFDVPPPPKKEDDDFDRFE